MNGRINRSLSSVTVEWCRHPDVKQLKNVVHPLKMVSITESINIPAFEKELMSGAILIQMKALQKLQTI